MKKKTKKWVKPEQSEVGKFRENWFKKGFELINITSLCELKLGRSGNCNNFNEPDEEIFHVQVWYRDENIAVITPKWGYVVDDDKYVLFNEFCEKCEDSDFIIFRKVELE